MIKNHCLYVKMEMFILGHHPHHAFFTTVPGPVTLEFQAKKEGFCLPFIHYLIRGQEICDTQSQALDCIGCWCSSDCAMRPTFQFLVS